MTMKRWLIALGGLVVLCGACAAGVVIYDDYAALSRGEFEDRLELGANEAAVSATLRDLIDGAPRGAEISFYPGNVVEQEDCGPRPCSLVDRGVPEGQRYTIVSVRNTERLLGSWVCADEYTAFLVFNDDGEYYRLIYSNWLTCL